MINLDDYSIIESHPLKPESTYIQWYEEEQTLIISHFKRSYGMFGLTGFCSIYKVTLEGIKQYSVKKPIMDYEYLPDTDNSTWY